MCEKNKTVGVYLTTALESLNQLLKFFSSLAILSSASTSNLFILHGTACLAVWQAPASSGSSTQGRREERTKYKSLTFLAPILHPSWVPVGNRVCASLPTKGRGLSRWSQVPALSPSRARRGKKHTTVFFYRDKYKKIQLMNLPSSTFPLSYTSPSRADGKSRGDTEDFRLKNIWMGIKSLN